MEPLKKNLRQYDELYETLEKSDLADVEIAECVLHITQTLDLDSKLSEDKKINETLYKFIWLLYIRYVKLNPSGIAMLAMMIELAKTGGYSLHDIIYDLKLTEEADFDGQVFDLHTKKLDDIKRDLVNNFPFNRV